MLGGDGAGVLCVPPVLGWAALRFVSAGWGTTVSPLIAALAGLPVRWTLLYFTAPLNAPVSAPPHAHAPARGRIGAGGQRWGVPKTRSSW